MKKNTKGTLQVMLGMGALFFAIAFTVTAATTWKGPDAPPTDVSNLDSVIDFSDFVSKSKLEQQRLNGPLQIFSSGNYPVFGGYQNVGLNIGMMGAGKTGFAAGDVPPLPASGNYGVYGFADTGSSNYGLYGMSASGVGVAGRVNDATDRAGNFDGPVRVVESESGARNGNFEAQSSITANAGFITDNPLGIGMYIHVSQARSNTQAISGVGAGGSICSLSGTSCTTNLDCPAGETCVQAVGVIGKSINSYGIYVSSANETHTALGRSLDTVLAKHGIYGYATNGAGVTGIGDPAQSYARGVYGQSFDYGVYGTSNFSVSGNEYQSSPPKATTTTSGIGVLACGTVTAAEFNGDVRIVGSVQMGIGLDTYVETAAGSGIINGRVIDPQVTLTEPMLQSVASQAGVALTPL